MARDGSIFLFIFLNSRGNIFQRGSGVILMGWKSTERVREIMQTVFHHVLQTSACPSQFQQTFFLTLCSFFFVSFSFLWKTVSKMVPAFRKRKKKKNSPAHSTLTFLLSSLGYLLWLHIFPCSTFNILPFLPLFLSYPAFGQWIRSCLLLRPHLKAHRDCEKRKRRRETDIHLCFQAHTFPAAIITLCK